MRPGPKAAPKSAAKSEGAKVLPLRPPRPCPICGKPSARDTYPFCSKRCADVDLNRWLSGTYAIPGEPAGEDDEGGDQGDGGGL